MTWRNELIVRTNKQGQQSIQPIVANIITILRHHPAWVGVLGYNAFLDQVVKLKPLPCSATAAPSLDAGNDWQDADAIRVVDWLSRVESVHVHTPLVHDAISTVARTNSWHPVRDYLAACKWDGQQRLATWLCSYCGVYDTPYARSISAKWLISAVARVMQPGAKADHMLVLEGKQGVGKSSALRILGGAWYTDELADMGSKDAALQLRGAWLIELAELDAVHRADASRVKAFISRTIDRYREPYGRSIVSRPRQCVFAGSSNHGQYLRDETGGRRFWPVTVGDFIDLDGLMQDRDQLWAEARTRYECGEAWWLTAAESVAAAEEQASRYMSDEWETLISKYVANKKDVSVAEVMSSLLVLDKSQWTRKDQMRIAQALTNMGWHRVQVRVGTMREWRYVPASPSSRLVQVGDRLVHPGNPAVVTTKPTSNPLKDIGDII